MPVSRLSASAWSPEAMLLLPLAAAELGGMLIVAAGGGGGWPMTVGAAAAVFATTVVTIRAQMPAGVKAIADPDRALARGLPPEAVAIATHRLAAINAAWDRIAAERGLT